MAGKYEIDMCSGSLFPKIVKFSIPVILTSLLQLLYNAVDIIVVGRYVGSTALAAVGSTSSLINLIVNAFIGLSVGTGVLLAQSVGANDYDKAHDTVHTAMLTSLVGGIMVSIFGFFSCRALLHAMGSPDDVIDQATLYMKIYFLGMPAFMIYTFGSVIMRTVGDTKRPLFFLSISGLVNVVLNLITVIKFDMGVAGVAIATIVSQYISAIFVVLSLIKTDGICRLYLKELKIHGATLLKMVKIGLPVAIQSSIFSFSNVIIQSSINSFGSDTVAGNAAAANIEGFLYSIMNAFGQAATTFSGQNFGAKQFRRVNSTLKICLLFTGAVGLVLGPLLYVFGTPLLKIYSPDNLNAIYFGMIRLKYICLLYVTCGIMEVFTGVIRGTGSTVMPMVVSIFGVCGVRIVWIFTAFQYVHTLDCLYLSYVLSWTFTSLVHFFCYLYIKKKVLKPSDGTIPQAAFKATEQ